MIQFNGEDRVDSVDSSNGATHDVNHRIATERHNGNIFMQTKKKIYGNGCISHKKIPKNGTCHFYNTITILLQNFYNTFTILISQNISKDTIGIVGNADIVRNVDIAVGNVDIVVGNVDIVVVNVDIVVGNIDIVLGNIDIVVGNVDIIVGNVDIVDIVDFDN